ncbi:MAG: proton-conducting transporter membrane subunit, partial [Nitrospira sp.]
LTLITALQDAGARVRAYDPEAMHETARIYGPRNDLTLATCFAALLFSLAGIPPLAGFFGKFYLFAAALTNESHSLPFLWLVMLGIICNRNLLTNFRFQLINTY